jgi:MFS family permease
VAPTTYSLLADYFPPERRGVPMGVFGSGVYVGVGVALIVGGLVVDALSQWRGACFAVIGCVSSWQLAFIIVGAPGLLLAGLVFLVYEPRRANLDEAGAQKRGRGLISYWRGGFSAIALHHAATVFLAMALYAVIAWSPEYLRRTFEIAPGRAGVDLGLIIAGAGMAGVIGWGALADVLLRRGAGAARVWTMAAAALIAAPAAYLFARAGSAGEAYVWFAVFIFGVSSLTNCGPVGVQELYPARLRGVGSAVFQFCVTLAGLGLGPTLVAAFSDFILKSDARLGDALAVTTPFMGLAAAFAAFGATRSYAETARRARDA